MVSIERGLGIALISFDVSGEPAPQIRWLKNGVEMGRTNSNSTLSLKIDAADLQSGGTYVCEAGNKFGTSRVAFVISIAAGAAQGGKNILTCLSRISTGTDLGDGQILPPPPPKKTPFVPKPSFETSLLKQRH